MEVFIVITGLGDQWASITLEHAASTRELAEQYIKDKKINYGWGIRKLIVDEGRNPAHACQC